jgi:hypothetical protein
MGSDFAPSKERFWRDFQCKTGLTCTPLDAKGSKHVVPVLDWPGGATAPPTAVPDAIGGRSAGLAGRDWPLESRAARPRFAGAWRTSIERWGITKPLRLAMRLADISETRAGNGRRP